MITPHQLRAARALLGWDSAVLADKVGITRPALSKIENSLVQPREGTMEKLKLMLEAQGIIFFGDTGVELKNDQVVNLKGDNIFFRVLDDVITTLRGQKNAEALFACVDDKVSPSVVVENYKLLRKAGIGMRSLVKENDTYLMGKLEEYRYLPEKFFHNSATVIYGDKFATMILDPETKKDTGAIIIKNPHVAAAQRNMFNSIWTNAEKPTKSTAKVRYDE